MTDFQAALGLGQLDIIEELIIKRIETAQFYDERLMKFDWLVTPKKFENRRMVYQTYHLLIDDNIQRDYLINYMKSNGVETNFGAYALNCLTYFQNKYRFHESSMENAVKSFRNGIALPMSHELSLDDLAYIVQSINSLSSGIG